MPKRTTDYRTELLQDLGSPGEASHYLNAALEDSPEMFLVALRDVAEARQMARVAGEAGVAREALYRMLCETGNPRYSSLTGILKALGLRLAIEADTRLFQSPNGVFLGEETTASTGVSTDLMTGTEISGEREALTQPYPITRQPAQNAVTAVGCMPLEIVYA
jgi:probable addiction module antidote protein